MIPELLKINCQSEDVKASIYKGMCARASVPQLKPYKSVILQCQASVKMQVDAGGKRSILAPLMSGWGHKRGDLGESGGQRDLSQNLRVAFVTYVGSPGAFQQPKLRHVHHKPMYTSSCTSMAECLSLLVSSCSMKKMPVTCVRSMSSPRCTSSLARATAAEGSWLLTA